MGAQNIQPRANETGAALEFRGLPLAQRDTALNAAAMGMADHHRMRHAKGDHRIFNRCTGAMVFPIRRIGRHQVGNIAVNEKLTLLGTKYRAGKHAAVAAGNHQCTRLLPLRQACIPGTLRCGPAAPFLVALHQIGGKGFDVKHASPQVDLCGFCGGRPRRPRQWLCPFSGACLAMSEYSPDKQEIRQRQEGLGPQPLSPPRLKTQGLISLICPLSRFLCRL